MTPFNVVALFIENGMEDCLSSSMNRRRSTSVANRHVIPDDVQVEFSVVCLTL